jgi:Type IV secretion system pilin
MEFIKKYTAPVFALMIISSVLLPIASLAAEDVPCPLDGGKLCNPIKQETVEKFLEVLLKGVIRIGLPIITLAIIYCGFLFVKARGNPEELTKAKDALLYTLIGAAILMGAWALATLIEKTVTALD